MRNIKLILEYDGSNYIGWQKQKYGLSIQGEIERVLKLILTENIRLISAGRTDAGVHAKEQVANFKTKSLISLSSLKKALNALLPSDIRVVKIEEADLDFHARFHVKSKTYRYYIYTGRIVSPFIFKYVWHLPAKLNYFLMLDEVRHLRGEYDFSNFQAQGSNVKDSIRQVYKTGLKKRGCLYIFEIEANGYLYKMVRLIVGTLVEIGRAKFGPGRIKLLLQARNGVKRGPVAPARGLFLWKVFY